MRSPWQASQNQRRASVSIGMLLLIPLLMLFVALAVLSAEAVRARTALQHNADSAALAAAAALFDDDRLFPTNDDPISPLFATAFEQARKRAWENHVQNRGVELQAATRKDQGDVLFGYRNPIDGTFQAISFQERRRSVVDRINAVRVQAHRCSARNNPVHMLQGEYLARFPMDAHRKATAMIERDIIGIRPLRDVAAPLVPIALRSDLLGKDKASWEYQIEQRNGRDIWGVDHRDSRPQPVSFRDGLPEMVVRLGIGETNACLLQLGVEKLGELAPLIVNGVRARHLKLFKGELVLDSTGKCLVPGTTASGSDLSNLAQALVQLRQLGEARVWPLSRGSQSGLPMITGFVVARVMSVESTSGGERITLHLQPSARVTASAVSARSRDRHAPANRYLAKLRLLD